MRKLVLKSYVEFCKDASEDVRDCILIMSGDKPKGIEKKYIDSCNELNRILYDINNKCKYFALISKQVKNEVMDKLLDMDFYTRTMATMSRYSKYRVSLLKLHLRHRDIAYYLCGVMSEAKLEAEFQAGDDK